MNQTIVDMVDPSLIYRADLDNFSPASALVYPVEKKGAVNVLKAAYDSNVQEYSHVSREKEVLERAGDISGITKLVYDYGKVGKYIAILKEYFEGDDLEALGVGKLDNKDLWGQLEKTLTELNSLGITNLDLRNQNIVLSLDRTKVKIIDMGTYDLKDTMNRNEWERLRQINFNLLKSFFTPDAYG